MQQEMVRLLMTSGHNLSGFLVYITGFVLVLGDVVVILDLRPDESLFEAGIAREVNGSTSILIILIYLVFWSANSELFYLVSLFIILSKFPVLDY